MNQDIAVRTRDLTKKYNATVALDRLNLTVRRGEVMGFLGPNGAGKTTTIRLLLGLLRPTSGSAELFGLDSQKDKVALHRQVAYVPGDATLWPSLTGAETLHLLGNVHGSFDRDYRDELVERFELDVRKKVRAYSKGNRQKVSLIAALMTKAPLLIFDEPTSGLDPLMEKVFRECVTEAKLAGTTVFLSSHILSEVEALADRVAIIRGGKLIEEGTLASMRHLSAVTVEATFAGAPPDVTKLKGVSSVSIVGTHVSCQVVGDIAPLLKVLVAARPRTLLSHEPTLEELFLSLYGTAQQGAQ